jgi:integrase
MSIRKIKNKEGIWVYKYDLYIGGRRVRTPRGVEFYTLEDCRDAISSLRTDYARGVYQFPADRSDITIKELSEKFVDLLTRKGRSQSYIEKARLALSRLDALMPTGATVVDIKTSDLERFISSELKRKNKPQSVYITIVIVMTALNRARSLFPALRDYRPPVKPDVLSRAGPARDRIITRDEEQRIIKALTEPRPGSSYHVRVRRQVAEMFWLALRTGMRVGEILALKRASVSFERAIKMQYGWIQVRATGTKDRTKTGRTRTIPMSRSVADLLRVKLGEHTSEQVFPSPHKGKHSMRAFHFAFREA